MHGQGEIIESEIGEAWLDDSRPYIRLRHGRKTAAGRTLEIREFDNLHRGIDLAYQVTLGGACVRGVEYLGHSSRTRLGFGRDVSNGRNADERDEA